MEPPGVHPHAGSALRQSSASKLLLGERHLHDGEGLGGATMEGAAGPGQGDCKACKQQGEFPGPPREGSVCPCLATYGGLTYV